MIWLTLALFMTRVGANDVNAALSADDLTVFANSFNAGADFHRNSLRLFFLIIKSSPVYECRRYSPRANLKGF